MTGKWRLLTLSDNYPDIKPNLFSLPTFDPEWFKGYGSFFQNLFFVKFHDPISTIRNSFSLVIFCVQEKY
jgi:hypothetical protein